MLPSVRPLSRLAVNFTARFSIFAAYSRLSRDYCAGGLAFCGGLAGLAAAKIVRPGPASAYRLFGLAEAVQRIVRHLGRYSIRPTFRIRYNGFPFGKQFNDIFTADITITTLCVFTVYTDRW